MSHFKDFKFTLKSKDGRILIEEHVSFGNEQMPWPEDWKNSGLALSTLMSYKETLIAKHFDIDYEEL